ncbi:MAG: sigma-54-dependent Fis family transcriptional regulator [Candidatus Binataceae bacterium]|nr:sigma-54-dependent Fis family transcriptional regulator [Candidatus Binataceae bacterium]
MLTKSDYRAGMVISSARLARLYELIQRVAPHNVTVLIQGESGSGKELIAGALHQLGPHPDGPLVTLNCATLVGQLAGAQLFGHVKGAFTDARESSPGYFRAAQGGTLFLDEVGELPLELQPKILRAVENHEIQPVGSHLSSRVDVRLVSATNRDLRAMVAAGKFRRDLYHRLNMIAVTTAPLRECRESIGPLAAHFINRYCAENGRTVTHLSYRAYRALVAHDWPGNVRELINAVCTAVLLTDDSRIDLEHLPALLAMNDYPRDDTAEAPRPPGRATTILEAPQEAGEAPLKTIELDAITRSALLKSLLQTRGNRQQAAKILGISRQKLYRMLARYDLFEVGRPA